MREQGKRSLSRFPAISSGQYGCYVEDNSKANEKIPDNIAQVQDAAAGYRYSAQHGGNGKQRQDNGYSFAKSLVHESFLNRLDRSHIHLLPNPELHRKQHRLQG
mgnify:CR=1 FL=1